MREMEGMKEAFNIFIDSCEKAGVKFSKEEKVEEWPKVGDRYFFKNDYGTIGFNNFCNSDWSIYQATKLLIFKTKESCEEYYSIIDTINNIVDELGRPNWEDFEDKDIKLYTIIYDSEKRSFYNHAWATFFDSLCIFPYCKQEYKELLSNKVSYYDLLWAFKKSMRLV